MWLWSCMFMLQFAFNFVSFKHRQCARLSVCPSVCLFIRDVCRENCAQICQELFWPSTSRCICICFAGACVHLSLTVNHIPAPSLKHVHVSTCSYSSTQDCTCGGAGVGVGLLSHMLCTQGVLDFALWEFLAGLGFTPQHAKTPRRAACSWSTKLRTSSHLLLGKSWFSEVHSTCIFS